MRFCTTHRACEKGTNICVVGRHLELDHDLPSDCTLVDALIVPKEDGKWPVDLVESVTEAICNHDVPCPDHIASVRSVFNLAHLLTKGKQ